MIRYLTIFSASLLFLISSCSDENEDSPELQWKKLGLTGKTVNQLHLAGSKLYVATTTGLFVRSVDANEEFTPLGFENKNVQALETIGANEWIASVYDKTGTNPPALYRSTNGGESWQQMVTNFGGISPEPVFDLALHPTDPNVLFASGFGVVAKSTDKGATWQVVYGDWGMMATGVSVVTLNPHRPQELWAGGQGAIENGYLIRTQNENDWDVWSDLVSNPTVVKEITFSHSHESELYVGFEGALLKTVNGGNSWQTLISSEVHKFFFGICLPEANGQRVYTGGWVKTADPQPLQLHISDDGGQTWRDETFVDEPFGGIWDMTIRSEGNLDRLFLGLDKGGVYEVTIVR